MNRLVISGILTINNSEGGLFTVKGSPNELIIDYNQTKLPALPLKHLIKLNKLRIHTTRLSQEIIITANKKEVFSIVNSKLKIKLYKAFYSLILRSIFK